MPLVRGGAVAGPKPPEAPEDPEAPAARGSISASAYQAPLSRLGRKTDTQGRSRKRGHNGTPPDFGSGANPRSRVFLASLFLLFLCPAVLISSDGTAGALER